MKNCWVLVGNKTPNTISLYNGSRRSLLASIALCIGVAIVAEIVERIK